VKSQIEIRFPPPKSGDRCQNVSMTGRNTDRTLFWLLLLVSLIGLPLGVPFTIAVLGDVNPLRIWLDAVMEFVLFLIPASAVGVWLGKRVDLGPRLLRDFILQDPGRINRALAMLVPSIIIGMVFGLPLSLGAGIDYAGPSPLEFFLRAISVSLTEEIFFRLGLMTLFVWILRRIISRPSFLGTPLHIGNMIAAVLFALAHLPGNVTLGTSNWDLVVGILSFNFIAGIAMGWLYSRYGLISPVISHFVADSVGYVIPIAFR